jgi:hypothetical protein
MNPSLATLAVVVGAYLIGSVSFAVVTSKLFGLPDPHSYGSGNPGATNVLRTGNKAAAALTLAGDGVKGWLAVWLAYRLGASWGDASLATAGAALAVFLGHLYPVFRLRWCFASPRWPRSPPRWLRRRSAFTSSATGRKLGCCSRLRRSSSGGTARTFASSLQARRGT